LSMKGTVCANTNECFDFKARKKKTIHKLSSTNPMQYVEIRKAFHLQIIY
jgi:hypothetical protein